jgi:lipopolysaccharide export system permease protein
MLNLIDRYILKQITLTLFFSLLALCVIFIVVNFMERMDIFMDSKIPIKIIANYYLVYLPEILKILTPVAVLISCLFTIGRLSNNNEITAMKTGGLGLNRLLFPILIAGFIFSVGQYFFNGWIVPVANVEKEHISRVYLNRSRSSAPINDLAFRDSPHCNVLIQYYDPIATKGYQVIIEKYDANQNEIPKLIKKIEARSII